MPSMSSWLRRFFWRIRLRLAVPACLRGWKPPATAALLAAECYMLVLLAVQPPLVHQFQCPIFRTDAGFARGLLAFTRPGGPVEYASALLSQLYLWPWAGAGIIAATILATCLAGAAFLRRMAGPRVWWLGLLAAPPLLALHSRYDYALGGSLAVLTAAAAAAGYAAIRPGTAARQALPGWRGLAVRSVILLVVLAAVYYLAGGAMLLTALLAAMFEVLARGRWTVGVLAVLAGGALPWLGAAFVFDVDLARAYELPLAYAAGRQPQVAAVAVYALLPLASAVAIFHRRMLPWAVGLWRWAFPARAAGLTGGTAGGGAKPSPRPRPGRQADGPTAHAPGPGGGPAGPPGVPPSADADRRRAAIRTFSWAVGTLLLLAISAGWALATLDTDRRHQLRVERFAAGRDWPGVLREVRSMPLRAITPGTLHDMDRALYHTRRLPYDMFRWPQKRGMPGLVLFWDSIPADGAICDKLSEFLLELGHVNEAEHLACEALETLGERPGTLHRLGLVYALKGQPEAASLFWHALARYLGHAGQARQWLDGLAADPSLSSRQDVARIRSCMFRTDQSGKASTESLLLQLLQANPRNRMAFEYLMAHYLLAGQHDKVAQNIGRLNEFDYPDIPRHYEEALMLHAYMTRRPVPLPAGRAVRPDVQGRLEEFLRIRAQYGDDRQGAWRALVRDFGDTYYFYYAFGTSGKGGDG